PARAGDAPLGRRHAGRRALRLPGPARRAPADRLRGRDRRRARTPPRRARRVRAERLADADPVARARRLRRGAKRHRGDAGAARSGLRGPPLRAAGTLGEGVYAIALRPSEPELLSAVDGALAATTGEGELRRILERWQLWDARQATLAGAPAPPVDAAAAAG